MKKHINLFLILFITVACYSCQPDNTKRNQELIIGDWHPYFDEYIPINQVGYQFAEDNQCENKIGFYSYFYPDGSTLDYSDFVRNDSAWFCNPFDPDAYPNYQFDEFLFNVNHAYGNKTAYFVKGDTLQIFDPAKQKWIKYHINFGSQDTLQLSYWNEEKGFAKTDIYIRKSYGHIDNKPLLEQIVFYNIPSCYSGPKYLLIRRDGLFFSYGYFKSDRFFIARMQPEEFKRIEVFFKQADIVKVLEHIHSPVSERKYLDNAYTPQITFIMADHQMKTIETPFRKEVPVEFLWGYLAGVFLPDLSQSLKPYFENEYPDLVAEFEYLPTIEGYNFCRSENYYLLALLCFAKEVTDVSFNPQYKVIGFRNEKNIMHTDGRYFRYTIDGIEGTYTKTVDIGFNFLEINGLE